MTLSQAVTVVDVAFDDPNLIADAGLVPVMALAGQVGLPGLVGDHLEIVAAANTWVPQQHAYKVLRMALDRQGDPVAGFIQQNGGDAEQ